MQETPCEFPAARGNNGIADGRACLWALRKANKKTPAALGDACVEMLSDMGSIPITSTRVGSVELFFFRNEFALVYRFGSTR